MSLLPLVFMWAISKMGPGGAGPQWPTPADPPPTPPRTRGRRAKRAPKAPTAPNTEPMPPDSQIAPAASPDAAPAVPAPVAPPMAQQPNDTKIAPPSSLVATSVLTIQRTLNRHGARPQLKPDGLFGPKTVSAWRTLAGKRGLDPTIVRIGPKTVDVAPTTLAKLNLAPGVSGAFDPPLYIP